MPHGVLADAATVTYLLTGHGTILCRHPDGGGLLHLPLAGLSDETALLDIDAPAELCLAGMRDLLDDSTDTLSVTLESGPLAGCTLTRSPDRRSVVVTRDGLHLEAQAATPTAAMTAGGTTPSCRFLPLRDADLAVLRSVLDGTWLLDAAGAVASPEHARLGAGFALHVGTFTFDLCWNLPFDLSEWPYRLTLLRESWRIVRLFRYRPLIYFVVFGDARISTQFVLSVESLSAIGLYRGEIAVITDRPDHEIRALLPPDSAMTLHVLPFQAVDRLGYLAARLAITTWPDAGQFQPLLYTDADVLFDRPVARMLYAIAQSDRISAPVEPHEYLATSGCVGGNYVHDDGGSPREQRGFNDGTLGIPNMGRHAPTLALIGRIMHNLAASAGRSGQPFLDQAVANYVAFRLGDAVDTALLSGFVRLAATDADPAERRGMVHYCWVTDTSARAGLMRAYRARLPAPGPPVFEIVATPDLAERIFRFLAALQFRRLVPGTVIANIALPELGIASPRRAPSGPVETVTGPHRIDFAGLVHRAIHCDLPYVEFAALGHRMEYLPDVEHCRDALPPPAASMMAWTPRHLVCPIDCADPSGADMLAVPVEFYLDLVRQTGLTPAFVLRHAPHDVVSSLRTAFPDATFLQAEDALAAFDLIRRAQNVVVAGSALVWLAAWLSEASSIYMASSGRFNPMQCPDIDLLPLDDARYQFYLFPVCNGYAAAAAGRRSAPLWRWLPPGALRELLREAPRFDPPITELRAAFDADYYLRSNPHVAAAIAVGAADGPWQHYRDIGARQNRLPFELSPDWYAAQYPSAALEVAQGDYSSFAHHYVAIGRAAGYRRMPDDPGRTMRAGQRTDFGPVGARPGGIGTGGASVTT